MRRRKATGADPIAFPFVSMHAALTASSLVFESDYAIAGCTLSAPARRVTLL